MSEFKDRKILFAAENTFMAWTRTSISLMTFGFVVERFGLFLALSAREDTTLLQRHISFIVGESFVILGVLVALYSILQHKRFLKTLTPAEIPDGYNPNVGMVVNVIVGILGVALSMYLARGLL